MSFEGSFANKIILITGGNSGIGAACAEYFAKEGALLALVGRNEEKFENVFEKFKESDIETEPLVIIADLTIDAERIINETIEKYGRLDILINNAGFTVNGTLETLKMEDYDAIMATNVRSMIELTQLAIPHLIESKGNIINIGSALGTIPIPILTAYSISKAAVDQFTKCAAMELAEKGVRVNSVNPGFIDTDFHNHDGIERGGEEYAAYVEQNEQKSPIQRAGNVSDCVNAIAFLSNDSASFITAIQLYVDGGLSTKGAF